MRAILVFNTAGTAFNEYLVVNVSLILTTLQSFFKWLEDEAKAKNNPFNPIEWKLDSVTQERPGCPTQTDDWNCGMFIIMYMDTLVKNSFVRSTSFSASEMPNYRLKLAKAITRGTLSN